MSKVGILVPTYKRPHLILRALDSIRAQTFTDWALVIVANGMLPEETEEYPEFGEFVGPVSPMLYPWFANVAQALQFGLAQLHAATSYVAVLEDDDEWKPEFLETMVNALDERPEMAMAYCDEIELDPDNVEVDWTGHPEHFNRDLLMDANWIHMPAQMWRYRELMEAGGFLVETSGAADWDVALRMSSRGVFHVREQLAIHHWLTERDDPNALNNCLIPAKMERVNKWMQARKHLGVYG